MFPKEGGQKHLVRNTKGQRELQERNDSREVSEKESCVKSCADSKPHRFYFVLMLRSKCGRSPRRCVFTVFLYCFDYIYLFYFYICLVL
jgi:hypothetical protein